MLLETPSQKVHAVSDDRDHTSTEYHEYSEFSGSGHHSSPADENLNTVAFRRGESVSIFWPDGNAHYSGTVQKA